MQRLEIRREDSEGSCDHLGPHLHDVSIYAPLQCTEKKAAKRLMTRIAELFPRGDDDWINDDDEDDEEQEGYNELENTEIVYESEGDELEGLERKLTKESDRRHDKWLKKQKRIAVISDDEEEDPDENKENEEEGDESVVDWDKLSDNDEDEEEEDRSRNGLFDNEAVESDAVETNEEVEGEDEEEDDGESLDDSDDERLFEHGPSRKRQIEQKKLNAKRRRIVVSDDEESD